MPCWPAACCFAMVWTAMVCGGHLVPRCELSDHALRDRDRVEIYRPLIVDPKEARRLRYKRKDKIAAAKA
jgi:hypothetical protein